MVDERYEGMDGQGESSHEAGATATVIMKLIRLTSMPSRAARSLAMLCNKAWRQVPLANDVKQGSLPHNTRGARVDGRPVTAQLLAPTLELPVLQPARRYSALQSSHSEPSIIA